MRGRGNIARLLVLAWLTALVAVALPAGVAGSSNTHCPDGYLCLWKDPNYQGERILIKNRSVSNKVYNKANDAVSSVKFRAHGVAVLYEDTNGEGETRCITKSEHRNVPDLAVMAWSFDNTTSSTKIADKPPGPCSA